MRRLFATFTLSPYSGQSYSIKFQSLTLQLRNKQHSPSITTQYSTDNTEYLLLTEIIVFVLFFGRNWTTLSLLVI